MSGTNNKLEIKNLSKRFGEKILFENLSLTVDGPAVLWAPSGWGKTTLLRILMGRSEEHTSELQSHHDLVCRLLLEKKIFLMIRRPPRSTLFPYTNALPI